MKSQNPPSEQLKSVVSLFSEGQFHQALSASRQMLETFPNSVELFNIIGASNSGLKQFETAIDSYKKALVIEPDHANTHYNLGNSLNNYGDPEAAIKSYKEALKNKPDFADAYYNMGNAQKNNGELKAAIESYKQALKINPDSADALLNTILHSLNNFYIQGQLQEVISESSQMLEIFPNSADLFNLIGVANSQLGQFEAAITNYNLALKIKPDRADVYTNMGNALKNTGDPDAAIDSFKMALKIKPDYAEAYNNMGISLQAKRDLGAAIDSYKEALKIKPDMADAFNNIGVALQSQRNFEAAVDNFKQALKINTNSADYHGNLGIALIGMGNREDALLHLKISNDLIRGKNIVNPGHISFLTISKAKIDHDIEQFEYLADSGSEVEKFQALAKLYRKVSLEIVWLGTEIRQLSIEHQNLLKETYNRTNNLLEAPELKNGALSDTLKRKKITKDYFKHEHGLTYIDNFLTPEALSSIRKFLIGSTIWHEIKTGGYLGAYLRDGLACPLLLQIAEELRVNFPKIFKNHQLQQLWAYKYDSQAYKDNKGLTGIGVHADQAAVNVNFWITPSTSNLNPESGGLIVHNTPAPMEWGFKEFNANEEDIKTYLENGTGENLVVPYNENRVVIFNSNLIHETDKFEFKDGYENRRINVTMLFGHREE